MTLACDWISLRLLGTLVCVTMMTGCRPDGVTWLPDSSGFVFVVGYHRDAGEELHLFDMATMKRRILITKTGVRTLRPAVSPDGKLIALARLETYFHKPASMRIIFFDREGKEQKRSSSFLWTLPRTIDQSRVVNPKLDKGTLQPTYLAWEHVSQKLVVHGMSSISERNEYKHYHLTAIYDPATDHLVRVGNEIPISIDGSITTPDGKGLLMLNYPSALYYKKVLRVL